MTRRARVLIVWSSISAFACDPSLSGYDLKRPRDASVDVSAPEHDAAPPLGSGGRGGAGGSGGARTEAGLVQPPAHGRPDARAIADAHVADAPSESSVCTLGERSNPTFTVASATELGLLEPAHGVYFRDGAASGIFGQTPVWFFHDTYWASDGGTFAQLPATAGFGDLLHSTAVRYDVDAMDAPLSLLSLTPDEKALDAADGGSRSVFLWPNAFAADDATGYVFYAKGVRKAVLDFDYLGTGIARLTSGKLVATRDPALLFGADEPKFNLGAVVTDGYLYLYACGEVGDPNGSCYVARAPKGGWADRKQYRFWDGCGWTSNVQRKAEIMNGAPNEITVSYNRYLNSYLAVYTEGRTVGGVFSNDAVFRTAPRPEGPWSDPVHPFTQVAPVNGFKYGAKEHREFSSESGKVVLVSYPLNLSGTYSNEIHLVRVTFE